MKIQIGSHQRANMKFIINQASGNVGSIMNHSDFPEPLFKGILNLENRLCKVCSVFFANGIITAQIGKTSPQVVSLMSFLRFRILFEIPILIIHILGKFAIM